MTARTLHEPLLTVVIPAHDPPREPLERVLHALRRQTLALTQWELVVVDDGSRPPLATSLDVSWHPHGHIITTGSAGGVGLVGARLRGYEVGRAPLYVFVDQDNVLAPDYLDGALDIARDHPWLGVWGGQIRLQFEEPLRAPEPSLWPLLCHRELVTDVWSNDPHHHDSTPWGAGLCARRTVLERYAAAVAAEPLRRRLDPAPGRMGYGGDSDIAYCAVRAGYGKGVFARLALDHLIPAGRCTDAHFVRDAEARGYSETVHAFIERGVLRPPRDDLRYWLATVARWPAMQPLQRRLWCARRRGAYAAVAELRGQGGSR